MAKLHSIGRKLQLLQNESRYIYHIFIALLFQAMGPGNYGGTFCKIAYEVYIQTIHRRRNNSSGAATRRAR